MPVVSKVVPGTKEAEEQKLSTPSLEDQLRDFQEAIQQQMIGFSEGLQQVAAGIGEQKAKVESLENSIAVQKANKPAEIDFSKFKVSPEQVFLTTLQACVMASVTKYHTIISPSPEQEPFRQEIANLCLGYAKLMYVKYLDLVKSES